MTAREKFEKMLNDACMFDDPDEIVEVVSDFLEDEANRIEVEEPYAVNTIREYRATARMVYNMLND